MRRPQQQEPETSTFASWQRKVTTSLIVAIIIAILGSVINTVTPVRYDPFTGTDARQMEQRIHKTDTEMERRIDSLFTIQSNLIYRMEQREKMCEKMQHFMEQQMRKYP